MSTCEHPIVDTGLIITPTMAAYINLYDDMHPTQPDQAMPVEIKQALDQQKTADAMVKNEHSLLELYGYMDTDIADESLDNMGIEHVYCNSFTGDVTTLSETTKNPIEEYFDDDFIVYVTTDKTSSPFNKGYGSIEESVAEFRKKLSGILPDAFDYEAHVVKITGTDFS